jgi:hypothetical protein
MILDAAVSLVRESQDVEYVAPTHDVYSESSDADLFRLLWIQTPQLLCLGVARA